MNNHYDYIIAGQGIAGTTLGYLLEKRAKSCLFIDAPEQKAASDIAAGIINPITGRLYVKSWRIEQLIPFAKQFYQEIEQEFDLSIYHEQALVRSLFLPGDENQWLMRSGEPSYMPFMSDEAELGCLNELVFPPLAYAGILQAAQVDINEMMQTFRKKWATENRFLAEEIDYSKLNIKANQVAYRQFAADKIVFCEGWRGQFNPFFEHLPFRGNKGEVLLIKIPDFQLKRILKHKVFIVPFKGDLYWVGSTSNNHFEDDEKTNTARENLENRLSKTLKVPYEIVSHHAAVRPTVKDRRPFLGQHPAHNNLYIFNGLGTKGASLAPYWANEMTAFLEEEKPLDQEVNISRFA